MANVCVSVSEDLKQEMSKFQIINWSEVARQAFVEQVSQLKQLQELTGKSKASEKDVVEIAGKVKEGIFKRHEAKKRHGTSS